MTGLGDPVIQLPVCALAVAGVLWLVVRLAVQERRSSLAQARAWAAWTSTGQPQPGWDPRWEWADPARPPVEVVAAADVTVEPAPAAGDGQDGELAELVVDQSALTSGGADWWT